MTCHHERARPRVQVLLEHVERVEVQVVGGLVEEQEVGCLHQHEEQLESTPLSSGKVPDR